MDFLTTANIQLSIAVWASIFCSCRILTRIETGQLYQWILRLRMTCPSLLEARPQDQCLDLRNCCMRCEDDDENLRGPQTGRNISANDPCERPRRSTQSGGTVAELERTQKRHKTEWASGGKTGRFSLCQQTLDSTRRRTSLAKSSVRQELRRGRWRHTIDQWQNETVHNTLVICTDHEPGKSNCVRPHHGRAKSKNQSNGHPDLKIRAVSCQVRTLNVYVRDRTKTKMTLGCVAWAWLIRRSAFIILRIVIGSDSVKAHQRAYDSAYSWLCTPNHEAAARWGCGSWLGRSENDGSHTIGIVNFHEPTSWRMPVETNTSVECPGTQVSKLERSSNDTSLQTKTELTPMQQYQV